MNLVGRWIAGTLCVAALAGTAQAQQTADKANRAARPLIQSPSSRPSETITISVQDGRGVVWSGALRIGGNYGNASFSQSRNEYAEPCPGEIRPDSNQRSTSESLNFSINRHNWQQEPDRFSISLNWQVPVSVCEGEGNDSFGFNRVVTLPPGQTVTVAGSGALTVKLTRGQ